MTDQSIPGDDERRRLERLRALRLLDSPPEPVFDRLVRLAAIACDTPIALVSLIDEHRQWFKANIGLPHVQETPRDVAFCAVTIESEELLEICDATTDTRFQSNPLVVGDPGIRFYAGAPLSLPSGERIGTLCAIDRVPKKLDSRQRALLVELAALASQALLLRDAGAVTRAEQALLDSERQFRELADSSPFGIFRTDASGRCTYTNPEWQSIYGLSLPDSLGTGWAKGVHPDDRASVEAQWNACAVAGEEFEMSFRVLRSDGTLRRARSRARPHRTPIGTIDGYVGAVEDVSDQFLAQQLQRDSEALLERAGRLAGVGGWRVELTSNTLYWSDQTCRIHDRPPGHRPSMDEAIGYYDGAAQLQITQAVEHAMRQGKTYELELPLVTATGRRIWVRTMGEVEYEDGHPVRLFGAFQDVTARREMEAKVALAGTRLRHLYERTPALLLSVDSAGVVLNVSDALLERTGFLREQLVGAFLAELLGNEVGGDEALSALFGSGRREREPCRLRCSDGSLREVLLSAVVEPGADRDQRRALAALEDVTEIIARTQELAQEHKLRRQVERHAQELDALLAERNEMLDVLAHEVRQPLNNASAALQSADAVLAQRGEGIASEQLRRAQSVLHGVLAGVDNTLAVASLLVGAATAELADVDLDMLLGIVVADMPVLERERVSITRDTTVRTLWVEAGLLRLALRNLLANALAYSPPESVVVIRLSESDAPPSLNIDVADQGPGIPHELQARLFQRGARGGGSSSSPSHGLGLYIAKRAMELQGGQAELMHTSAHGTCMRLRIPQA